MAEIEFIDKDPEQILVDTIAMFQTKAGTVLNDADPERILIDCMAYREVLLRNGMEWLMRQNFVQLAEGSELDWWGQLFGVVRVTDESDDTYRLRILAANKSEGLGTKAAYKSRILSLPEVADVRLYSKNDDPTLLPGRVRIVPIMKITDPITLIASGDMHNEALETTVLAAILTDDFGVVGNVFQFTSAVPVVIDGAVNVRATTGFDPNQLEANIDYQLNRYFGQLSLSFTAEFGITVLTAYLNNAAGLQQVVSLNFPSVPILATGEFYQRGVITINIE
jgi:hypothetical protein